MHTAVQQQQGSVMYWLLMLTSIVLSVATPQQYLVPFSLPFHGGGKSLNPYNNFHRGSGFSFFGSPHRPVRLGHGVSHVRTGHGPLKHVPHGIKHAPHVKHGKLANHFRTPIVFPPHSPSAHLTTYSSTVPSHPITFPPTPPTKHLSHGISNHLLQQHDPPTTVISKLKPIKTIYNAPSAYVAHSKNTAHSAGCPQYLTCAPASYCAGCFEDVSGVPCHLKDGSPGLCCPPTPKPTGAPQRLFSPPDIKVNTPDFSIVQLNEAAEAGLWQVAETDKLEETLRQRNIRVTNRRSPEYRHLQFFKTSPRAMRLGRAAITVERSSYFLMDRYKLSPIQAGFGLKSFSVSDTMLSNSCPEPPSCGAKEDYYRTIDGSCNNVKNPTWGRARTSLQRILPPQYDDGLYEPRGGSAGRQLPSARVVSISNVADVDMPDTSLTLSVMQFGQFIDHDLTHVPIFRFGNESGIECCSNEGRGFVDRSMRHPACLAIPIPADDPFFSKFGRRCMNFVRSMPTQNDGCTFGHAEQMNQITHFLDGSNIYGSNEEESSGLRLGRGGLLNVQGRALLPPDTDSEEGTCDATSRGHDCFSAGDSRVNEQPDLAVIHTIWMREHNRLALQLAKINPHWDDETLFQEARRITVAQMQHIVYNEWLPVILGKECMVDNKILPRKEGFSGDYDSHLNPTILNEFATVAFRFGHSLVQGMVKLFGKNHKQTDQIELHEHFNSPHLLYTPGKVDEFLRGLAKQPMQKYDNFVSQELTNRLFQGTDMPFGMDLVALNVQRARDHGIPSYNDLREACGLPRARNFYQLSDVLSKSTVQRLESVYSSVDDIDPFIAGIAERPLPGAVLGPTFKCIIADQFIRLRRGDRFFYEHGGLESSFTEAQLREIKQSSWARIMCDNGDYITAVQPLAMRTISKLNPKVSCKSKAVPGLDLTPWVSVP